MAGKASPVRHCFVRDNDGHWYLIPAARKKEFERLLDESEDELAERFGKSMVSGYNRFTFENPKEVI